VRERNQLAFPDDSLATGLLGGRTESCACDRAFGHRVILIHAIPTDPDCTQQPTSTPVDRLASGKGDDAMVAYARRVIDRCDTGQGPIRIRIPEAKQRRHSYIRANVCGSRASGAIGPGKQPDRLAV
jgi:hypothetical protein